ncbi:MAG: phage head closure protein, partial [Hyphomicrobiales bacterium]|nr:phage head closure protein [Hyphomicrobiales bacterium]
STYVYSAYASVWGVVVPLRADLRDEAGAGGALLTHEVVIRRRLDLTTAMRFRIGARILAIRAVDDGDATRRAIVCRCEEASA